MKDFVRNLTERPVRGGGGGADLNRGRPHFPARVSGDRNGVNGRGLVVADLDCVVDPAPGAFVLHSLCQEKGQSLQRRRHLVVGGICGRLLDVAVGVGVLRDRLAGRASDGFNQPPLARPVNEEVAVRIVGLCSSLSILTFLIVLVEPAALRAQDGEKVITNSIGMKLTLIPAGKFVMGSPADEAERDPEELQHEVTITKPFYLGVFEVTQREYEKVTGKNPSHFKKLESDQPVEQVRWTEAADFCNRLSNNADEKKAGRVYRLPTEAEWEYACRAGTTTAYHHGAGLSAKLANFDGRFPFGGADKGAYLQKPAKVGSYAPNAWGLYDMHGNVAEWCADWYDPDYYKTSPKENPPGPAKGVLYTGFAKDYFHVVRGGCWNDEAQACRSAYRFRLQSGEQYRWVGLRVLCEVTK